MKIPCNGLGNVRCSGFFDRNSTNKNRGAVFLSKPLEGCLGFQSNESIGGNSGR